MRTVEFRLVPPVIVIITIIIVIIIIVVNIITIIIIINNIIIISVMIRIIEMVLHTRLGSLGTRHTRERGEDILQELGG